LKEELGDARNEELIKKEAEFRFRKAETVET
jgi:hypothetical protein